MGLSHDKEGFLTGPKEDIDTASYAKHIAILREIRADGSVMRHDLSAIRKALTNPPRVQTILAVPMRRSSAANEPRMRAPNGRFSPSERAVTGSAPVTARTSPSSRVTATQAALIAVAASPSGLVQPRKTNGQFGAGSGKDKPDDSSTRKEKEASTALSDAAGDLKRSAGEILAGSTQIDPTLAAAKEVKDIVAPAFGVFKPLGRVFRRKSGASDAEKAAETAVPWYRRLWNELRSLNKKGGKGGGGLLGMLAALAGLIVRFSGLGLLAKLLTSLLARAGLGAALGGLGGGLGGRRPGRNRPGRPGGYSGPGDVGGMGDSGKKGGKQPGAPKGRGGFLGKAGGMLGKAGGFLGRLGRGALRKLPLVGALLAGGSAAYSIFGGGNQTKKERFEGAGSGIGSIIGGAIGLLGGPLGVIAGAAIGDIVGEKVGTWLSTVDWADVGNTISDAWKTTTEWTKNKFDGAVTYIQDSWKSVSELGTKVFTSVSDWFSEKLGKAKELASTAVAAVSHAAGEVVDRAKSVRDTAYEKGSAVANKAADIVKNTASTVTGGLYKGGSDANKVALIKEMNAQGIKDPKEQAMFLSQMDHESGGFKHYEENLNYGAKGLRKTFGKYYTNDADAERDARNPEAIANRVYGNRMGNTDAGDGYKYRGRGAIQLTGKDNYNRAGKALGLDLVNNPDLAKDPATAAKIAAWYWKDRKLGEAGRAGDVTAATKKINGGTNGLDDRKAKYDQYLAQANGGGLTTQTADQSKATPPQAVARAIETATTAPRIEPVSPAISVASKPVSYSPTAPDLIKYAPKDAPAVKTPLASSSKPNNGVTRIETPLTQNLGDRQIAAVATGGIGMQQMRT